MTMFECSVVEDHDRKYVVAKGRIDALSSSYFQKALDELILAGERALLLDLSAVNYVSSAGLRVFVTAQKGLKKVGGEVILMGLSESVLEIFKMSGLTDVFRIVSDRDEAGMEPGEDSVSGGPSVLEAEGALIEYLENKEAGEGSLFLMGTPDKLEGSTYGKDDVVEVGTAVMECGCGLGTLGDIYDEYKDLFGESMIVNGSFFFYPAVKHPSVDFLLDARQDPSITYKFFHGFGFKGPRRYVLSFQGKEGLPVELTSLVKALFALSRADALGLTIIAESRGLWGMHLKKVPLLEQKPADGRTIFDKEHFPDWIDFPLEPSHSNHILVGTGIAVRDRSLLSPESRSIVSEGSNSHIHGAIFEKAPISTSVAGFDNELTRLFSELEAYKVQHILGRSRFSRGMAAIVELEA